MRTDLYTYMCAGKCVKRYICINTSICRYIYNCVCIYVGIHTFI